MQTTVGSSIPVAPSLGPAAAAAGTTSPAKLVDRRVLLLSALAVLLALAAAGVAQLLTRLIGFFTNLAFYGRLSSSFVTPWDHHLGAWVIGVPVVGGLIVGVMARYGSQAIRGHGIPEAMEQVLTRDSKIPARITLLKPLSAAIAIGTGGPFGAEGPIIATGGALGSLLGQFVDVSAQERKTLLAAGAAAGMAATFGTPVSAALLAVELLLFELRPRSLIPVALATATATAVRAAIVGPGALFPLTNLAPVSGAALLGYLAIGLAMGGFALLVTRAAYWVEDQFEHLPVHWMWWPAVGALAVGVVGYFAPRTLGVGYTNIEDILSGALAGKVLLVLFLLKFVSWAIALGSGTSGGTLAPLFTIGGGIGSLLGAGALALAPACGVDPRLAALVGMAALFAGASRAFLASVVFAFEITHEPFALLPLFAGCTASYLVSCLVLKNTIMTEKIARRGVRVIEELSADPLAQIAVSAAASRTLVSLAHDRPLGELRRWLAAATPDASHQGYPVVDGDGALIGVVTRRDLLSAALGDDRPVRDCIHRPPATIEEDASLRQAANVMIERDIGRLAVVARDAPRRPIAMLTRSDVLAGYKQRLEAHRPAGRLLKLSLPKRARAG